MSDEAQQSWQLGLKLTSYGHGANLSAVAAGEVTARGNRVKIKRDSGLTEWYENSARGLEQGFTIDARAELRNEKAPLRLGLELSGSLKAQLDERGQQVGFSDEQTVLVYEKLAAWDAKGQELEARMELGEGRVWLVVEDEGAVPVI